MNQLEQSYIAVDLDGTLIFDTGWKGPEHFGPVIPAMLERVQRWLTDGRRVKIFTARADDPRNIPPIREWLRQQGLPDLEITNCKDRHMEVMYDDRAVEVVTNTGRLASPLRQLVRADGPVTESMP